jgi:hypothetical protein
VLNKLNEPTKINRLIRNFQLVLETKKKSLCEAKSERCEGKKRAFKDLTQLEVLNISKFSDNLSRCFCEVFKYLFQIKIKSKY